MTLREIIDNVLLFEDEETQKKTSTQEIVKTLLKQRIDEEGGEIKIGGKILKLDDIENLEFKKQREKSEINENTKHTVYYIYLNNELVLKGTANGLKIKLREGKKINKYSIKEVLKYLTPDMVNKIMETKTPETEVKEKGNEEYKINDNDELVLRRGHKGKADYLYIKDIKDKKYYRLGDKIEIIISNLECGTIGKGKKQIEKIKNDILEDKAKKIAEKSGNGFTRVNSNEDLDKISDDELKKSVTCTVLPTGVSYVQDGKHITNYNGISKDKSDTASNGIDKYITIPGNIRIGIEQKAHATNGWDPITPILYLIFNNKNNKKEDNDYTIGVIDGHAFDLLKPNFKYSNEETIFIGDKKWEDKPIRRKLRSKEEFKNWISPNIDEEPPSNGIYKYHLNNINSSALGLDDNFIIHPILGHDEYINNLAKPLAEKYDIISIRITGALNASRAGKRTWGRPSDVENEDSKKNYNSVKTNPSIFSNALNKARHAVIGAAIGAAAMRGAAKIDPHYNNLHQNQQNTKIEINQNQQIINRLIDTVEGLKNTCEMINKNFNTTIGVECINKFNVILQRLQKASVETASVKTKYFNY